MLAEPPSPDIEPPEFLAAVGDIFACFDRQDSGNVSFGVAVGRDRYFVKTAGPSPSAGLPLRHRDRVALLDNAERLARNVSHSVLTVFEGSLPSAWGPMLVYRWADGEHLHAQRECRDDPDTAWQRFLALPRAHRLEAVHRIVDLHVALSERGWVTGDFYDGCLIYDFATRVLRVFDLDSYRLGPYPNTMGRMIGSTRFMAPEEFEKGRTIDERTTVFAMGRTIGIFLGDIPALERVTDVACADDPRARYATVAKLAVAFRGSATAP